MKDVIFKVLGYLPHYFSEFGACFIAPKTFARKLALDDQQVYINSLVFMGISVVIFSLVFVSTLPGEYDIWRELVRRSVFAGLGVIALTSAVHLSWRAVGGRAPFRSDFILTAYSVGLMLVLVVFFLGLYVGVVKTFYPADVGVILTEANPLNVDHERIDEAVRSQPDITMTGMLIAMAVLLVGLVVLNVWSYVAWGAYRELHDRSKGQSALAALAATILTIVFFVPVIIVDFAFLGGAASG